MDKELRRLQLAAQAADRAGLPIPPGWNSSLDGVGLPTWNSWTEAALDSASDTICPQDSIEITLEGIQRAWHYEYLRRNPSAELRLQERPWVRARNREERRNR